MVERLLTWMVSAGSLDVSGAQELCPESRQADTVHAQSEVLGACDVPHRAASKAASATWEASFTRSLGLYLGTI